MNVGVHVSARSSSLIHNQNRVDRRGEDADYRCHFKTITPSHDRPTISTLPIPREEDKTGTETQRDLVIGKGKIETVIPDLCERAKERPFPTQRQ